VCTNGVKANQWQCYITCEFCRLLPFGNKFVSGFWYTSNLFYSGTTNPDRRFDGYIFGPSALADGCIDLGNSIYKFLNKP
jgi:hypothetical protein